MRPLRPRKTLLLTSLALAAGLAPVAAGLLNAQVRRCYIEKCSTVGNVTICSEKEVPCPAPT